MSTTDPNGNFETVAVSGEFDIATSPRLRMLWTDTTAAIVVVDTSAVTFMDASGVGVLVEICECLAQESRRLRITGVPPRIRRLFELVGVCDHLGVESQHQTGRSRNVVSTDNGPEFRIEPVVGRLATLHLNGVWDDRSRAAMTEAVTRLIETRTAHVRIDMSGMTMIDEAGAAAIRSGLRRLAAARIEFRSDPASRETRDVERRPGPPQGWCRVTDREMAVAGERRP